MRIQLGNSKNLQLEGLRGLASLNVVLAHFMFAFMPYASHFLYPEGDIIQRYPIEYWLAKPYISVLYNGTYPVSIFFVMSGWVLTAPFMRADQAGPLPAAVKRYPRLVLPVAAAIFLAWALYKVGAMAGTSRAVELGFAGWLSDDYKSNVPFFPDLLLNMFITAPVNGHVDLDTPLWTLRIELLAPLLLFALIALFGAKKILPITLVFVSITLNIFPANGAAMHFLAFLLGYLLNFTVSFLRRIPIVAFLLLAAGVILGAFDFSDHYSLLQKIPLPDLSSFAWNLAGDRKTLFHTLGGLLTVAGVLAGAPGSQWLALPPFTWLGKVSFSAYLLHWPIVCSLAITLLAIGRGAGLSYPYAVALAGIGYLIAVYIAAMLFERWVDAPAIRFANRLSRLYISKSNVRGKSMALTNSSLTVDP
jgi:peptidoglycan/LPS O-acetylase OafA/YrhL